MAQERDRLTEQMADLARAREALDEMAAVNRAHRETLEAAAHHRSEPVIPGGL